MAINLLSWCWIGISAFLFGIAGVSVLKRLDGYARKELDTIILLGICFLTVFAQFFSLFYKVGKIANIVLAVLDLFFYSIFYKNIRNILNVEYKKGK